MKSPKQKLDEDSVLFETRFDMFANRNANQKSRRTQTIERRQGIKKVDDMYYFELEKKEAAE